MDATEQKILVTILISAGLMIIIFIFFVINIVKHQRKFADAYKRQIQAEIITLEAERKRMASDFHDDLGPFLSSMKLQLNLLNTVDEDDREVVEQLTEGLQTIIQKVRDTSNNLLPNVLTRQGLLKAINAFALEINKLRTVHVTTDIRIQQSPFTPEQEIHIYRIVQEAINNCIKHANASVCNIKLSQNEKDLVLELSDNGKGFDSRAVQRDSLGFGLRNILSRTDILGGEMFIKSKPGNGVYYKIEIPVKAIEK